MAAAHLRSPLSLPAPRNPIAAPPQRAASSPARTPLHHPPSVMRAASNGPLHATSSSTLQQTPLEVLERSDDEAPGAALSSVEIRTLRGCKLGIARYPDFAYNADGGGGPGTFEKLPDGKLAVDFDVESLYIPAVERRTTKFLGLPLPPFLCIRVLPQSLRGVIDRTSGKVELEFSADFLFSVGSLYRPPPLKVHTLLTTERTGGRLRNGQGHRLNSEGKCKLVGVAPLDRIQDSFMNAFLTLPTDCLAVMEAQFHFGN